MRERRVEGGGRARVEKSEMIPNPSPSNNYNLIQSDPRVKIKTTHKNQATLSSVGCPVDNTGRPPKPIGRLIGVQRLPLLQHK